MPPRIPEQELLRNKVLISLNDQQYGTLLDEACKRNLAPSIVARLALAQGLSGICRKRQIECGENHDGKEKGGGKTIP